MIVVDSSFLVAALTDAGAGGKACADRLRVETLAAPDVIGLEAVSAIRGLLRGKKITEAEADRAVRVVARMPIRRAPLTALLERSWELRDNCTPYDAAYIALAEALDVPLVTAGSKLKGVPKTRCVVEVVS
ncbi:type II toxin-antitoxin system VapC family toxin [Streptomyces sp. NPDC052236]|uniref:type II toxin-antitoxin system VapC family toxin n=1 Tax=Streptomyces sp. NPDC052236 TaxID=3365686 RepID=UPI0037D54049